VEPSDELRKKAEESLQKTAAGFPDLSALTPDEIRKALHELQVHQLELEMQNNELRRLHRDLEEANEKYTELYEFAPVGYFTLDEKSFIREVNHSGARLLAKPKSKSIVMGAPFSRFVHPDDVTSFARHLKQLFQTGEKSFCEIRLMTNGEELFVRLESVGAKDPDGKVTSCRMIVMDLTDRRRIEQALENSEQRFKAVCENTEEIIIIKDTSRRCTYMNPAAERLLGVPASQLLGTECLSDPLETPRYERDLDARALAGATVEEEHTRTVGGAPMVFLETRLPMRDGPGKITGILFVARDITDRKLREVPAPPGEINYPSRAMQNALHMARIAAAKGSIILLLGESGSGKDFLAQYIHRHSERASGPYFAINCAALPPELAESELFGHEKGAFTGAAGRKRGLLELAEGGTLLLNEIGELSPALQSKLLAFLDTRSFTRVGGEKEITVNARLIAATNKDLEKEVEAGRFRADLFFRLNVFPIEVPPLRERREDIPIIVRELTRQIQKELQTPQAPVIDRTMMEAFMKYDWPGNVRELRNVLERALMLSDHERITLRGLGISVAEPDLLDWSFNVGFPRGESLHELTAAFRRALIEEALRRSGGSRQEAARLLGITRYSLKHYMKSLGIGDGE
jgi:PAS domain S-box-containing protein